MNFATFERAQVAAFAYREAAPTGSLDCIKAVCHVIRNRVKAGWGDGTWLAVIDAAPASAGNVTRHDNPLGSDRLLQLIVHAIDDIYLGQEIDDDVRTVVQDALYYTFMDREPNPWFVESVIRNAANHPRVAQIGTMMLFK